MTKRQTHMILLILIFGLANLPLAGCSGGPAQTALASTPTAAPLPAETQPDPTHTADPPTPTSTLAPPTAAPTAAATHTPSPTPTPASKLLAVREAGGWVTYRNEPIGYEISAPNRFTIKGALFQTGELGDQLLGPAVPNEEITRLVAKYYGDSLWVSLDELDSTGHHQPWLIMIAAYDILTKKLGFTGGGGMGDYQLTARRETLHIDGVDYPVRFTVWGRHDQWMGEAADLYIEKDGVRLSFGFFPQKEDSQAYQVYLKDTWPVIRQIIETYRFLPKK